MYRSMASTSAADREPPESNADNASAFFECNVCLDVARDPVVSMCGHLFCWPCIHQWIETRPHKQECPVCKAGIGKEKLVPIYGRGQESNDPRKKDVPPRPAGTRPEPDRRGNGAFANPFGGNMNFSFGIGAFPFGFFGLNFGNGIPMAQTHPNQPPTEDEEFLSKLFLYIGLIFIVWIFLS